MFRTTSTIPTKRLLLSSQKVCVRRLSLLSSSNFRQTKPVYLGHRQATKHIYNRLTGIPHTQTAYNFSKSSRGSQWHQHSSSKNNTILVSAVFGLGAAGVQLWRKSNEEDEEELYVDKHRRLQNAVEEARDLVQKVKDENGCPGIVVAVSVDGKEVWAEGFGFSDLENRLPCSKDTVMRIASISKPITMALVAKLWERGQLDIDKPIQHYLPDFPQKEVDGKKVEITTRQLVSHLGGIRHYDKKYMDKGKDSKEKEKVKENQKSEFEMKEYYIKDKYKNISESLKLFQDDPLVHKPGSKFLYTSHGWTLISAVVEAVGKKDFAELIKDEFKLFGMENSYLDENEPIIYNRSRNYVKNKKGKVVNAPYVDNSYKWAGGGYLSTVGDLLKFAHIMLYSYQHNSHSQKPSYLKPQTMEKLWTVVDNTKLTWDKDGGYGMGWGVVPEKQEFQCCRRQEYYVTHTGGAVGASSVLIILPHKKENQKTSDDLPKGVCVTILTNLISVSLNKTAKEIGKLFEEVSEKGN